MSSSRRADVTKCVCLCMCVSVISPLDQFGAYKAFESGEKTQHRIFDLLAEKKLNFRG